MRVAKTMPRPRVVLTLLAASLAQLSIAGPLWAQNNQPLEYAPLWYEGTVVSGLLKPNAPATSQIPNNQPDRVLQPFYFIITPGAGRVQDAVVSAIPGDVDYTGWWRWSALLDFSGRDLASNPYTSVGEITAALCNVGEFPTNIGTCVINGTPLIDVTGFNGATDFVFNIPVVSTPPEPAACE